MKPKRKLSPGAQAAYEALRDRKLHSLDDIAEKSGYKAATISARIRELPDFGIYYRKQVVDHVWMYVLVDENETLGERNAAMLAAYRGAVEANPIWTHVEISVHLGYDLDDCRRLGKLLAGPDFILGAYEDGLINDGVADILMSTRVPVSAEDKRIVIAKIAAGIVSGTKSREVRDLLKMLPSTRGLLRLEWIDPERAMTMKELEVAWLTAKRRTTASTESALRTEAEVRAGNKVDWPIKASEWIERLDSEVDVIEGELPAIMAHSFQAELMAEKVELAAKRLWELAQRMRGGAVVREQLVDPRIIDL